MNAGILTETMQSARMSLAFARNYLTYSLWMWRERPENLASCVEAGDTSIYYHCYGRGEPVLILHGGFAYSGTWAGQIPELACMYRVIAPDSRGHGRSTLGTKPLTYRQMAGDMAALITKLRLGAVHLVGWSDGGCTSLALALEHPELVRSMVLLGTPFNTDNYTAGAIREMEDILHPWSPSMLGLRFMRRLMTPEARKGREFLEKMTRMWRELPDFTAQDLGRIQAPTLVIGCDRDEFLSLWPDPLRVFKETAAAIPDARLEVIAGGTHIVSMERPREVNALILDFLQSL
jgi:pimeloyl-ACP methyl ester carboxylesterase